jgi:hypothetical protein
MTGLYLRRPASNVGAMFDCPVRGQLSVMFAAAEAGP